MSRRPFSLAVLILLCVFAAACARSPAPSEVPASPIPTRTRVPTAAPIATPTATRPATRTVATTPPPTATATATPTPAPLEVQLESPEQWISSSSLTLHFNQAMNPARSGAPLEISPRIEGELHWNETHTDLTFTPSAGFEPGRTYAVRLGQDLESATGAALDHPREWTIRILTTPRVERRLPTTIQLKDRRPAIHLVFNRAMDPQSLEAAFSIAPEVPFTLRPEEEELFVEPLEPLTPGTRYTLSLAGSASDVYGATLGQDYVWSYRLDDVIAGTTVPSRSAGGGESSTPLVIRFNYAMDVSSVERSLRVHPPIEGRLSWNEERTVVSLAPSAPLPSETAYTVQFGAGLRDAHGERLSTPDPIEFTTPPPILAVSPPANESAPPGTLLKVTFDRLMDQDQVAAAFQISPTVSGRFGWEETSLLFRPDSGYLDENTTYTVTIGTSATDLQGDPVLREPYRWSFSTGQFVDLANFGWGPNAQVVDADGRRAVQFGTMQADPTPLSFELYRLSLEQFLDRYASGFRGVAGWERHPIDTEGARLVKRWNEETPRGDNRYGNVQEVLIPDDVPPGLYILNLVAGHVNDQLILVLTHNTIAVKQAQGQIVAWVSDINGGSAANVEVSVFARDGQLLSQGRADQNGVYRAEVSRDPQPLIVVARDGDDLSVSGLSNEWRSGGDQWWGWWRPAPQAHDYDYAAHLYTDRPIYRPGQTVFFKGIIRHDDDAILSLLPEGSPVTARVRDARNNVVQTFELTANHFGTVNGEFQLAEGAMLGDYAIEMALGGESHRQVFKVQDYRKPDYQIDITTNAERYVVGESIAVSVEARYFYGEPVPNAQLTINQYALVERYWWDDESDDEYIWYQTFKPEIRGRTDADGRFTFTLDASLGDYGSSVYWQSNLQQSLWGIEVTADDGSHQTVSSFAVVQVLNGAQKIRLDSGGYFKTPGQPFTVRVAAASIDDEPVGDRDLRLTLRRYDSRTHDYSALVQAVTLTTGADGKASTPLTVAEPGYYQLFLEGRDRLGQRLTYESWLYVFGGTGWWSGRDSELHIAADQESYGVGDIARLVIESPFSGPALLTFERGSTRREQLIELTAPLTLVEVPIQPDDAPNIFVTVNAWQEQETTLTANVHQNLPDSRLHTASVELVVPVTGKTLHVTITPDKEWYAPRERASFRLKVTNAQGEPVSAELSLALVDEAIFSLSDELSGPIFDAFYHERERVVRTFDSMALIRYIPDWGRGGGGGDGGFGANPRSDFPDTAAWFPILHTDWKGEASVELTLPDNLTSWRLTAKAVTPDTQVGETFINVLTQQEIVVRPILPRSLTAGDRVALSASVHNYSDQRQIVQVSIKSSLLEIQGSLTQSISLAPGERQIVGWSALATEAGEAQVTVIAAAGAADDAVRLTLPIRPLAIPEVDTQIGEFSGQFDTTILLPDAALDQSVLKIELSRSIAGSLLTGLEYLTGFPYGCVEQTMSRALPNAVVGRAFHQLGVGNPALQADLPAKINAGLQRLYGYQHNDGGWGWWYDDSSHDYQTAWVVFGLSVTAEAGYEVDPAVIKRGVDWLTEHLDQMDMRTRAYALYSMATAGYGDVEATRALAERLNELDTFSQAALALALHELGIKPAAEEILDRLAGAAVIADGKVHWPNPDEDGHYTQKTMASTTRSTALALSAFVRIRPNHALEAGIVRWLMGQRRQNGWGSTNETSFAILALTDHLLATELATADTDYGVELNGTLIASGVLGRGEPAVSLEIPASQMARGTNQLRLRQSGGGRLYFVINHRVYLPETAIEAAGGIGIRRTYLDAETNKPIETARPGQLVKISLEVRMPDDGFYVIVEDNLPGGLEALNEGLNTSSHEGNVQEPHYYWETHGYNNKEVHGDRVSFFITELDKGQHSFTYVARATHAGEFVALPAEAYAMYDPTVWGRSASSAFTIAGRLGAVAN